MDDAAGLDFFETKPLREGYNTSATRRYGAFANAPRGS
jgi:hypothetical protein